jgi:hypothetical protein
MTPMTILFLCLPAALLFVVCVCGVAVLWPTAAQSNDHPRSSRQHGGRSAA